MSHRKSYAKVEDYMTRSPFVIEPGAPISQAVQLMRERNIRHLPVQFGERLVGIVSDRALKAASLSKWADQLKVSDIMVADPYIILSDTRVEDVVDHMIQEKIGSVLVTNLKSELVGIFTTIDALKILRAAIQEHPPKEGHHCTGHGCSNHDR